MSRGLLENMGWATDARQKTIATVKANDDAFG